MDQSLVSLLRLKGKQSVRSVAEIQDLSDMKTEVVTANAGPSETETIGDTLTSPFAVIRIRMWETRSMISERSNKTMTISQICRISKFQRKMLKSYLDKMRIT